MYYFHRLSASGGFAPTGAPSLDPPRGLSFPFAHPERNPACAHALYQMCELLECFLCMKSIQYTEHDVSPELDSRCRGSDSAATQEEHRAHEHCPPLHTSVTSITTCTSCNTTVVKERKVQGFYVQFKS